MSDVRDTVQFQTRFHGCFSGSQALFFYTMLYDVWEARFWDLPWTDACPEGKGHRTTRFTGQPCPFTGERTSITCQGRPVVRFLRRGREKTCIAMYRAPGRQSVWTHPHCAHPCYARLGSIAGQMRLQLRPHTRQRHHAWLRLLLKILKSGGAYFGDCHNRLRVS